MVIGVGLTIILVFTFLMLIFKNIDFKQSIKLEEKWIQDTTSIIESAHKDGLYYDYSLNNSKESDLDETLRYAEIYFLLNKDIPKSVIEYLDDASSDSNINKLKKNYLINDKVKISEDVINSIISDPNTDDLEKVSNLFFTIKYSAVEEDVKKKLSDYLIKLDPLFLKISNGDFGHLYEYTYLLFRTNLNSTLNVSEYINYFDEELEKEDIDLVTIFYLQGIINNLEAELSNNQVQTLKKYLIGFLNRSNISSLELYIITTIYHELKMNDEELYLAISQILNTNEELFSTNDGGFAARRIIQPNIVADLLARVNLNLLGTNSMPENIEDYLLLGDYWNWRLKILSFLYFDNARQYEDDLRRDIITFNKFIKSYKVDEIYNNPDVIENIYFVTEFYKVTDTSIESQYKSYYSEFVEESFESFNFLNSTDQRYLIDIMLNLNYDFDQDLVINELKKYFNEEEGIFIKDNRKDILLNYDYSYILNELTASNIYNDVLLNFINETGGFNTITNQNETSGLISTYYGLLSYKNI